MNAWLRASVGFYKFRNFLNPFESTLVQFEVSFAHKIVGRDLKVISDLRATSMEGFTSSRSYRPIESDRRCLIAS